MTECKALVTPSTDNGHRVFSYTLESHTAAAFAIMNELRLERQLCDVTLRVRYKDLEAVDFVAHKVVLASSSPVFRAMFTNGLKECGMEMVSIEGIHPRVSQNRHLFFTEMFPSLICLNISLMDHRHTIADIANIAFLHKSLFFLFDSTQKLYNHCPSIKISYYF